MHRGDTVTIAVGPRPWRGEVVHVGQSLLTLQTAGGAECRRRLNGRDRSAHHIAPYGLLGTLSHRGGPEGGRPSEWTGPISSRFR